MEQTVVDLTLDAILRPGVTEWIADRLISFQEREGNTAQLLALREELAENKKARENIMRAIEAGIITPTVKDRLRELEAEGARLEDAITVEEASITRVDREFVLFWLEKFRRGDRSDKAFRRQVIDSFVSAVYLYDDHIRIAFNFSGGRNEIDAKIITEAETLAGPEGSLSLSDAPPHESQANPGALYFVDAVFVLAFY